MTCIPADYTRRRFLRTGFAAATLAAASAPVLAAPNILTGAGAVRVVNLTNPRTGERLNSVYWVEGSYVPEVLAEVDHIMRDWRADQKKRIDPGVIDVISATHKLLDTTEPFALYSGYRSPETNRMLRARNRGVARDSYHIKGMAADLHMARRSVRQVSRAALSLNGGGVGRYSRSNFVHVDCGPVRTWGR
jgi:uncharacterized protein YcbK (DUF882 family)